MIILIMNMMNNRGDNMFAAGKKEMQMTDHYTINELGLPGAVLMENAGQKVVEEIIAINNNYKKIVILVGGGNNGGDGFVIGRKLWDMGYTPILWLLVPPEKIKGDANIHFNVYKNRQLPISYFNGEFELSKIKNDIEDAEIIVDAMMGTGIKGEVRPPFQRIINFVNENHEGKTIVAVDIPSGLNSETGKVEGAVVKATKTITFVLPKKGFFLQEGPKYIGEWKAVDISVPPSLIERLQLKLPEIITPALVKKSLPKRIVNGHKGSFGHVLVIGGSKEYVGAPQYTAKAAFYSGAGLVSLAIPDTIYPIIAGHNSESIFMPIETENGVFSKNGKRTILSKLKKYDTVAIGPGLGRVKENKEFVLDILNGVKEQSVVIDADGLHYLKDSLHMLKELSSNIILTPHPGEMANLLNISIQEVESNRLKIAEHFATSYNVFLVLKGHRTIMATPNGALYINPIGNDSLSKGGSGDVLTGFIASFLAQGASPSAAMIAGGYLHAKAGECLGKKYTSYSVTPMDLIQNVKYEIAEFSENNYINIM